MIVSIPQESCYYYECSDGKFRLTYFIPPIVLKDLCDTGKISPKVMEDFPDGVDLDCTEPDFDEFHRLYNYRPEHSPDVLRDAFFAIFSSTRGWKTFRGTGMMSSEQIESMLGDVEKIVEETIPEPIKPVRLDLPLRERRFRRNKLATFRSRIEATLVRLEAKGVDPGKALDEQKFRKIKMSEGIDAGEMFVRLQRKQRAE